MGATTFYLLELDKKRKDAEKKAKAEQSINIEELSIEEIEKLTKEDIKKRLKELNIEFKSNDSKDDLISKLKGEVSNEKEEETPDNQEE